MNSTWVHLSKLECESNWKQLFHSNGGLFYGEDSIVRVFPFAMFRLTLFFIISQALHRILRPLKQTLYVCKVMAGIMLGPSVLGKYKRYEGITNIPSQRQFVNVMCYMGFLYHVFIIAVKTDSTMILRFRKQFWVMGTLTMFMSFIVMAILLVIIKPVPTLNVIVNSFVLPLQASSAWFINLVPLLEELNLLTTEIGQLSLSLALTNEFLMWSCAIFIIILKTVRGGFKKSVLPIIVFMGTIFLVIKPIIAWVIRKLPRGQPVKDVYVVCTLLLAGITALFSDVLVGSPLMGVVFLGLVVPHGPPLGLAVVERSETFVKNSLLPFLFLAAGDSVCFDASRLLQARVVYQVVLIIGHITKMVITSMCAIWYNMSPRQGISLGLLLNTSGAVHIMVYWSQYLRQRTDSAISSQMIVSSLIVTSIATPLAVYFHKQSKKEDHSVRGFQLSVQSALMSSRLHILACVDSEDDIPGIINLIKASNPTNSHPICVYLVHLIELVGQAAPMLIPHKKHHRICRYNGCVHIMNAVKAYCDTTEGGVTVQLLTMIAPFTTIYESICKLAEEKMIPLVIVPFVYKSQVHLGHSVSSQLNHKLQQQTPCTLAIFVNRDNKSSKQLNQPYFSYHVAVIFCGGEDDREVLAYAARMSTHPGVSITLLRVFIEEYDTQKEDEILLDNSAIDKFKAKVINNACAIYKEFHVDEWLQTLNVVQSLEKSFDLVMIGRRHGKQASTLEDDLYILSENPELGDIGELIVSGDLQWENTSFLVMQHCLGSDKDTTGNLVLLDDSLI